MQLRLGRADCAADRGLLRGEQRAPAAERGGGFRPAAQAFGLCRACGLDFRGFSLRLERGFLQQRLGLLLGSGDRVAGLLLGVRADLFQDPVQSCSHSPLL